MHSDYSILDSCTNFSEYIDLAVQNGHKAIAFTEHGKPLGWVSKKLACDKAGVRYIHGVEIYLTESLENKVRDNYHTVLLARNLDGVKELNKLVSMSCEESHFYYVNRISFEEFLGISKNILSTSACLASPLNRLPHDHRLYMKLAMKYDFLEVQPHVCDDQAAYNQWIYELSQKTGKPLIAGTDTHSASQYKAECRSVLLEAKHKSYGDEDLFDLAYKTRDELLNMFSRQGALPEDAYTAAIENTNLLFDLTEDFELDTSIKYPILYESRERDSEVFTELVERRFADKLSSGVIPPEQADAFRGAIDEEMRVFRKLNMDGFMLSMSELITWCKDNGMAIGTARGSVGGSRVAYIADIIDLNPETWRTVFSRFCNESRKEIGDIDIDCVETDRPAIFRHIVERFGKQKTARVASFGTIADKGFIDDAGRAFRIRWKRDHPDKDDSDNPYSLPKIDAIKSAFDADPDKAKSKCSDLFYYFDGLVNTKVSQSVHPAGMVISPITLDDNYGVFNKDGESCLMLDMEELHEVGAAKYDFLILKTVQVIRDTCAVLGMPYPKSHEINWEDAEVWKDMIKNPAGIFQFESAFAFDSLRKYKPKSLFDMSLVTAAIRPSGQSYRASLLAKKQNMNCSKIIDNLLEENNGYLVYQEDVIKFLQQICGLSGSDADNVRRAIGRKDRERLDKALPAILDGYCSMSEKPREEAEVEAKEFIQILEDSASYMFGYNHSIAYCMLGYYCAFFRYYHPTEFITAFLNNAANEDDIRSGTALAASRGVKIISPKFGRSRSYYSCAPGTSEIYKGVSSVKFLSAKASDELFELAETKFVFFSDLIMSAYERTSLNARQLSILVKIGYFSEFGNETELLRIIDMLNYFKNGEAKKISAESVRSSVFAEQIKKNSTNINAIGRELKTYTITNMRDLLHECETMILNAELPNLSMRTRAANSMEYLGYVDITTGEEKDRPILIVKEEYPIRRKKDNALVGHSIITQSVGSGIESRFSIWNSVYNEKPVKKGDIILCKRWERDKRGYYNLIAYEQYY